MKAVIILSTFRMLFSIILLTYISITPVKKQEVTFGSITVSSCYYKKENNKTFVYVILRYIGNKKLKDLKVSVFDKDYNLINVTHIDEIQQREFKKIVFELKDNISNIMPITLDFEPNYYMTSHYVNIPAIKIGSCIPMI
jgi:hypothetical protein